MIMLALTQSSLTSAAERPAKKREFPHGKQLKVEGEDLRCFDLEDWKAVGHYKLDASELFAWAEKADLRLLIAAKESKAMDTVVQAKDHQINLMGDAIELYRGELVDVRRHIKIEKRWRVVAVFGAVLSAGLVAGFAAAWAEAR